MHDCSYCGRENEDVAVFCRECGTSLKETASSIQLVAPHRAAQEILWSTWKQFAVKREQFYNFASTKRAIFLIGGILWFLFALGFAGFLFSYIVQGAGWEFFGPTISSESIGLGLVHVVGLFTAIVLCFSIGAGLCAYGIVRETD